jgi:hypothetical protein
VPQKNWGAAPQQIGAAPQRGGSNNPQVGGVEGYKLHKIGEHEAGPASGGKGLHLRAKRSSSPRRGEGRTANKLERGKRRERNGVAFRVEAGAAGLAPSTASRTLPKPFGGTCVVRLVGCWACTLATMGNLKLCCKPRQQGPPISLCLAGRSLGVSGGRVCTASLRTRRRPVGGCLPH